MARTARGAGAVGKRLVAARQRVGDLPLIADDHHIGGLFAHLGQLLVGGRIVPAGDRPGVGETDKDRISVVVLSGQEGCARASYDYLPTPGGNGAGYPSAVLRPFFLV